MDPTAHPIGPDSLTFEPVANARRFVAEAVIPEPLRRGRAVSRGVSDTVSASFATAKDQAAVVGSEVISFVSGVTAERREAIVNSSLLAQLVANTKVTDPANVDDWYKVYFSALMNIGWVVQETNLVEYRETAANFEAHKAILGVAAALFGPASTALALVTTTINALHSMDDSTPWITIFNRESQAAQTARFQIGLATQESDGQFLVSLMAFALKASTVLTQVLFFKSRASEARLRHRSSHITINTTVLDGTRDALRKKLVDHANRFISTLPDLA